MTASTHHWSPSATQSTRPFHNRRQRPRSACIQTGAQAQPQAAIIGAGVVGLATALQLQQAHATVCTHIVYERPPADTTSCGAGGALLMSAANMACAQLRAFLPAAPAVALVMCIAWLSTAGVS